MQPSDAEQQLDTILAKIDADLPKIHRLAKKRRESERFSGAEGNGTAPSNGLALANLKQTRMAFAAMAAAPILTADGDDLEESEEPARPLVRKTGS